MTRLLVACASALAGIALAGAAAAADLPPRYGQPIPKAPPMYSGIYNWTGFYLGINGGGGFGRSEWDTVGGFDVTGGLVGGTAGYNWQTGAFVFGIEGDIDWSNIKGSTTFFCALGCATRNDWLGTVRGRVGYAFDRVMPYLTGGLAFGNIKATTPFLIGNDTTNAGWTAGAGLEVAFMGNWSAKAEYLYVDLGQNNCGLGCGTLVTNDVSFTSHVVRGGINYRF